MSGLESVWPRQRGASHAISAAVPAIARLDSVLPSEPPSTCGERSAMSARDKWPTWSPKRGFAVALSLLLHVRVFCLLACSLFLFHSLEETTPSQATKARCFSPSLSFSCLLRTNGHSFFLSCGFLPLCSRLFLILAVFPLCEPGAFLVRTWLFFMFHPFPPKPGFSLCSPVAPAPQLHPLLFLVRAFPE